MADVLLAVPVLLAGFYLVGLAAVAFIAPQKAKLFLSSFASSRFAHFAELFIRLVIGASLVSHAAQMRFPILFTVFGWTIVVTTMALFVTPWRWHRRFARWSVPLATRNMSLFGIGSLAAGALLLLSLFP
jgi:uncharacterized protein YjeT (DUF2065 family)